MVSSKVPIDGVFVYRVTPIDRTREAHHIAVELCEAPHNACCEHHLAQSLLPRWRYEYEHCRDEVSTLREPLSHVPRKTRWRRWSGPADSER